MLLDVAARPIVKKALQYTGENFDELVNFTKCKVLNKSNHDGNLTVDFNGEIEGIRITDWIILNPVTGFHVTPDFKFRNIYYICEEKRDNEIWYDEKFDR